MVVADSPVAEDSTFDNHQNITVIANNSLNLECPVKKNSVEWRRLGTVSEPEESVKVRNKRLVILSH